MYTLVHSNINTYRDTAHTKQQMSHISQRRHFSSLTPSYWNDVSWVGQGQLLSQPFKVLVPSPHFILTLGKTLTPCGLVNGTKKDEEVVTR